MIKIKGASPFRQLVTAQNRFINFDNAATTPPFVSVLRDIMNFSGDYSSVHRGSGSRADYCSSLYDKTRVSVLNFFGTDSRTHTAIFTHNTTDGMNRLANMLPDKDKFVIVTEMEHHSNDLPWRRESAGVLYAETDSHGALDMNHLESLLKAFSGRVAMVSLTGASNVTGIVNPIRDAAALAHRHGAYICVDAAQLAPHRQINMIADDIDFLAFSGHKMYAPFGIGALIGRKEFFDRAVSDVSGGGTVDVVTKNSVSWAGSPERFEAGTPNLMGVAALESALNTFDETGFDRIEEWESALSEYLFHRLSLIDGIKLFSPAKGIGVISFIFEGMYHRELAERLGYEAGIEVRSGCFCAQPYIQKLLGINPAEAAGFAPDLRPGMVRISPGLYNNYDEADALCDYLLSIRGGGRYLW